MRSYLETAMREAQCLLFAMVKAIRRQPCNIGGDLGAILARSARMARVAKGLLQAKMNRPAPMADSANPANLRFD